MGNLDAKVPKKGGGFFPKFRIKHVCSKFDLKNKHVSWPKFAILGMYVATLGKKSIGSDRKSPILGIGVPSLRKPGLGVRWRRTFLSVSGCTFCASGFETDGLFFLSWISPFCLGVCYRRSFFSVLGLLFCLGVRWRRTFF